MQEVFITFIKDLNQDEVRDGFFIQSDRKKIWERWLEIWQEVDRICRKHEINYWAGDGTLLGAARHGGFVPWDNDMSFYMMRPEFNRFCDIVATELNGETFEIGIKVISGIQIQHIQTTFLRSRDLTDKNMPKGLAIEIFPLDVAQDGTKSGSLATIAFNELFGAVHDYSSLIEYVENGGVIINDWSIIEKLHALTDKDEQLKFLSISAEKLFDLSSTVNLIKKFTRDNSALPYQKSWFRETIYLTFESVELPAPVYYDKLLTTCYGDWHKPVRNFNKNLDNIYSTDVPYKEFLELINLEMMLGILDDE